MKHIDKAALWYFSKGALPYWGILFIDCVLVLLSDFFGVVVVSKPMYVVSHFWSLLWAFLFYMLFYLASFRFYHTYSGIFRFSSFVDLRRVGVAIFVGLIFSLFFQIVVNPSWLIHIRSMAMILSALVSVLALWTIRILVKMVFDSIIHHDRNVKCFIYGIKRGGIAIAKNINSQDSCPYNIAGFLSDDKDMEGRQLMGQPVFLNDDNLIKNMKKRHATVLIVSPFMVDNLRSNNEMINKLIDNDIKIMIIPMEHEWDGKSDLRVNLLREVNVEDLLPRDKIEVDMDAIGNMLRDRCILITGAAGSIGSEIVRQVAPYRPSKLVLIDQAETPLHDIKLMMARQWPHLDALTIVADIANQARMEELFAKYTPEYVFHAAAYKHVPMMENNPGESVENNVNGTRIVADLAVKYGTKKFVMVSTDKAVNPTNVMGCSKRICEIYVQSLDAAIKGGKVKGETCFVTTRFGNVLGSNGSVIPLFEKQIKAGGPVTVTHPDIIRFFMLIPEACKLVLEAGTMGKGGEIFVFDMGKPVRIADLAQRMINMSGAKDIEIRFTGLRDGEKLYEEVLNEKEVTLPTFHEKINIAKVREYDYDVVSKTIGELIVMATSADDMTVVAKMKAIVPEFKSQHSKYEVLDK